MDVTPVGSDTWLTSGRLQRWPDRSLPWGPHPREAQSRLPSMVQSLACEKTSGTARLAPGTIHRQGCTSLGHGRVSRTHRKHTNGSAPTRAGSVLSRAAARSVRTTSRTTSNGSRLPIGIASETPIPIDHHSRGIAPPTDRRHHIRGTSRDNAPRPSLAVAKEQLTVPFRDRAGNHMPRRPHRAGRLSRQLLRSASGAWQRLSSEAPTHPRSDRSRPDRLRQKPESPGAQLHTLTSTTTGTWSDGFSQSRTSSSMLTPAIRSAACGDASTWSMRMPQFRSREPA